MAILKTSSTLRSPRKLLSSPLLSDLALKSVLFTFDVLRRALEFEVAERSGRGRLNMTWKRQVKEHSDLIGLKKEDATD